MAAIHTRELSCDLDGQDMPADTEPVTFAIDGEAYEIDLCDDHASELSDALRKFRDAARRARMPVRRSARDRLHKAKIREWARHQRKWAGRVSDRGRLPAQLCDDYAAAQAQSRRRAS